MKVDDPVDILELTFVLDEVVAEARRLKILIATFKTHSTAGEERAVDRIKFDAISMEFSVTKLN